METSKTVSDGNAGLSSASPRTESPSQSSYAPIYSTADIGQVVTTRPVVTFYRRMLPKRLYPLTVRLSPGAASAHEADEFEAEQETGPKVTIEPVIPGSMVTPPRVEVRADSNEPVRFWVLPLCRGRLRDARVTFRTSRGETSDIPLSMRVGSRRFAWFLLLLAIVVPLLILWQKSDPWEYKAWILESRKFFEVPKPDDAAPARDEGAQPAKPQPPNKGQPNRGKKPSGRMRVSHSVRTPNWLGKTEAQHLADGQSNRQLAQRGAVPPDNQKAEKNRRPRRPGPQRRGDGRPPMGGGGAVTLPPPPPPEEQIPTAWVQYRGAKAISKWCDAKRKIFKDTPFVEMDTGIILTLGICELEPVFVWSYEKFEIVRNLQWSEVYLALILAVPALLVFAMLSPSRGRAQGPTLEIRG